MRVRYELDKDKFVKVYNELRCDDIETVIDRFGLFCEYDRTSSKTIKDIMYAIKHNINFEISDINTVKKINNMYSYYEKPNRLTQQEIIDCIKEVNELQLKLQTQTMATVMEADIIGKDYNNKVEMVLTIFTNSYHLPEQIIYARQGSMLDVLDKIKECEIASWKQYTNGIVEHKQGFIGDIFKSIFNWK